MTRGFGGLWCIGPNLRWVTVTNLHFLSDPSPKITCNLTYNLCTLEQYYYTSSLRFPVLFVLYVGNYRRRSQVFLRLTANNIRRHELRLHGTHIVCTVSKQCVAWLLRFVHGHAKGQVNPALSAPNWKCVFVLAVAVRLLVAQLVRRHK
jgi:hypothetical protein